MFRTPVRWSDSACPRRTFRQWLTWRKFAAGCVGVGCFGATGAGGAVAWFLSRYNLSPSITDQALANVPPPPRRTQLFVAGSAVGEDPLAIAVMTFPVDDAPGGWSDLWFPYVTYVFGRVFALRILATWRAAVLVFRTIPVAIRLMWLLRSNSTDESRERGAYRAIVQLLSSMGPSYIKLGQWMATRPDLWPRLLCDELTSLYDDAPPHGWETTHAALRSAGVLSAFTNVSSSPLNSGSIAQVHVAELKEDYRLQSATADDIDQLCWLEARRGCSTDGDGPVVAHPAGTKVVLKVQHPGIQRLMLADLFAMRWFSYVLRDIGVPLVDWWLAAPKSPGIDRRNLVDPVTAVTEFGALLLSQLDFVAEADNLVRFRYNFRDQDNIVLPCPLLRLSSSRVLVEKFEVGERPDKPSAHRSNSVSSASGLTIANAVCTAFLRMLFVDNFLHADLHPGNLLRRYKRHDGTLTTEPVENAFVQLCVLDHGLALTLTKSDRTHIIGLFTAILAQDGKLGARLVMDRAKTTLEGDALAAFEADIQRCLELFNPTGMTGATSNITEAIAEVMVAMRRHNVRVDMQFATLLATMALSDGVARVLAPEVNFFRLAAPYVLRCLETHELAEMSRTLSHMYLPRATRFDSGW